MGTERRTVLKLLAAAALPPAAARTGYGTRLAAAWQEPQGRFAAGVLAGGTARWRVLAWIPLPTRAHAVAWEPGGTLLVVARRPGDWLLRWSPRTGATQWAWSEPDRSFNGHAVPSADGIRLYTTETDHADGSGIVGVRDARSLQKLDEWASGGMDPHQLLADRDGSLLVANGGIPTRPESGRAKLDLARMDSSLVRLDPVGGALQGQWRLADPRLGVRHLAWGDAGGRRVLGVALQAEHDDARERQAAPVFALFDGARLREMPAAMPLAGYGGAVAFAAGRFAVSCPRAGGVACHAPDGRWAGFTPLEEACALAGGATLWAGGRHEALAVQHGRAGERAALPDLRLDNHWALAGA